MFDAVFYEAFEEEEKFLRKVIPQKYNCFYTWKSIQENGDKEPAAAVISMRTQSKIPLDWQNKLKGIITRSTGYDHISAYLADAGADIPTAYLPDYAARAVAEQALMMWAALLRKLNLQKKAVGHFHRDGLTGREIRGRRITVLGVGHIGGEIVDIACGLGMKVLGVDIVPRNEMIKKYGLKYVSLEEGMKNADIAVCALPLTPITKKLLCYEKLKLMPKGGIYINIARGEISPNEDMLRLLEEKRLSGIGLDVYENENELAALLRGCGGKNISKRLRPENKNSIKAALRLLKHPNCICTPHNAFNTEESVERKCLRTSENLVAFLETGKFSTPIPS